MSLKEAVEKYLAVAGGYGRPVAISQFGLSRADAEKLFSALDEDYHISRYFDFSNQDGESFNINGFPQTHISIGAEIQSSL
jgi:hypothetical protein